LAAIGRKFRKTCRYIDTENSHTLTADDLVKLLEQAQHHPVMLISDTAGMGKSTVLTHFCKQIKKNFPGKWVVRFDLNDHTDALKAMEQEQIDKENAIEFVSKKLLKLEPGLELELFKECFEKEQKVRIVIMLDGFDEISPFYKQTVIDLLQALRQTAVEQLWVTTRPHLREELEDELQQLSYTLEPFSEGNQVEFLSKFWSLKDWLTETNGKGEEKGKSKLEIYAEMLVKKLSESISDKDREFTGIPLQTRMLAEAFDEEVKEFYKSSESKAEISDKLDLLGLYKRFLERKYDIYQEEKFQVSVSNVAAKQQRERNLKSMSLDHQLLALKKLFDEETMSLLRNNKECSFSVEQLTRFGIVHISCEGKPHFIHRTFAEYYVADCLVNHLTEGNNTSQQVRTFILKDIFLEDDYRVIRAFVDGMLSRTNPSMEVLKQYGNQMQDLRTCDDLILRNAALEGKVNIIEFMLASVQASDHRDKIKDMLLAKDEDGFTAWIISVVSNNTQVLEKLWEWAEKKLADDELMYTLLLSGVKLNLNNSSGQSRWNTRRDQSMLWRKKIRILRAETVFGRFHYEGQTVWHVAAYLCNLKVLEKLWVWAKEKLSGEEIKKLLLATDRSGMTGWHWAAVQSELGILEKVWKWVEEKLTAEEVNKFLLATDSFGSTVWHMATQRGNLDILLKVWNYAEEKLAAEEINKLLLATDVFGSTGWHLAAKRGKLDILEKVWNLTEEKLAAEEINKLLLATNSDGRTGWHLAAYLGELDILEKVWKWAEEKLTAEEINKLLLTTDRFGRTVWHLAAERGNLDILLKVWNYAEEKLAAEEINKFLLATDRFGSTGWHVAAHEGKLDILEKVWKWAEEKLTAEEINKLLLATDRFGRTGWHVAANRGKLDILELVWNCAEEKLAAEEINKLLLATDSDERTGWHLAARQGNLDILEKVWKWAEEKLTAEEINKLLLATDRFGKTGWHLAAEQGKLDILEKVRKWAEEKLTAEEVNKLLLATEKIGRSGFNLALEQGKLDILESMEVG